MGFFDKIKQGLEKTSDLLGSETQMFQKGLYLQELQPERF